MKKILLKTDQNNPAVQKYIKAVEEGKVIVEFLQESNAIENVWDGKSLLQAIRAWKYIENQKELTVSNILKTHGILMKGKLDPDEAGAFRKCAVWIGGHEAKPWYVIPELIEQWIKIFLQTVERTIWATKNVDTLTQKEIEDNIKADHIMFESIHPFVDGNGRMGRILLNWQRAKINLPILVIKEAEKWDYYKWFMKGGEKNG